MNKRKGILENLIKAYFEDSEVAEVFNTMLEYYAVHDLDKQTNHYVIFRGVFVENKSYEDVASENFIHINTLRKYIVDYNRLAVVLMKERFMLYANCG